MSAGNGTTPLRNPLVRGRNIVPQSDGIFVVGTANSITQYRGQVVEWGPVDSGIVAIGQDRSVYAGAGNHPVKYDSKGTVVWSGSTITSGNIHGISIGPGGYLMCWVEYSNGTYSWPGLVLYNPDGTIAWADNGGNSPNGLIYNFTGVAADRNGGMWCVAYKSGTLLLQRRSISDSTPTEFVIDTPAAGTSAASLALGFSSRYIFIASTTTTIGIGGLYKFDTYQSKTIAQMNLTGSIGGEPKMCANIRGEVYVTNAGKNLLKIDATFTSIQPLVQSPYTISSITSDTNGNYYVSYDYQDAGLNDHWVVAKYNVNDQQLFYVNVPSGGSYLKRISAWPGVVAQLFPDRSPDPPNEGNAQAGTNKIRFSWDYDDRLPASFVISRDGKQLGTATDTTFTYTGTPAFVDVQAKSDLGRLSSPLRIYSHPSRSPEALAYIQRVIDAGGAVNDTTYLSSLILKMQTLGIWNSFSFGFDMNLGLVVDASNNISKTFDPSNLENDTSPYADPLYRVSSLGKGSSLWVYTNNNALASASIEMINSTAFFILKHQNTHAQMIAHNTNGISQILEDGSSISINGTQPLGAPSYGYNTQQWHIAHSMIQTSSYAKVGVNGTWGAETTHASTTWPVNIFGYYSGGSVYNWDGEMAGVYIFNTQLSDTLFASFLDFLNAYYGIF